MNAVLNPLSPLKALLNEIIRTDDATRLAECLQGKYLPAIGGHEYPAGILHRALSLPPIQPELPAHLAALLAILCFRRAQILAEDLEVSKLASASAAVTRAGAAGGTSPDLLDDEPYVFNLFLFATYLPPNDRLFEALKVFYQIGLNTKVLLSGGGRAARQLRQALTFQQVDASMEEHWLGLIHREISGPLKAEERSNFLDCWTALLWIPPSPADRDAGRTLTIERVEKGLLALHKASGDIEGLPILRYAVRQLSEAYPRSPEFWARQLGGRMKVWPELLRMVVVERWPILAAEDTGTDDLIPEDAREVWRALGAKEQAAVRMAAAAGDRDGWLKHWTDLVFTPPNIGLPPQQTLQQLQLIRASFEANFPGLDIEADWSGEETHAVEEEDVANTRRRMPYRHTSRFVSFERVSKVMAVIQQLLQRGDLSRARKFLEDQIRLQEADGTEPELIVKTLSNAAAGSLEHRHIKWAEELYNKAITYSVNDPIPHNGLAEVLKAKGDLAGAETLYREIISRWPENVVAHNGLAEVLKAKDDLAGAETLYRETISRWPENVVAHNGLAEVLKAKDDLAGAETLYRETISRWPHDVVAHNGLAEVLKAKDDLGGAETLYRETISRWPHDVVAHTGLAEVLKAKDDLGGAETLYRETISRWPENVVAHNGLAEVLKAKDDLAGAETLYRETISRWPENVVAHNGLAEVLKAKDDLAGAETLYRETISRWPENVVAHNGLAEILKAKDDLAGAETLYREIISRWPENVVAHTGLAEILKAKDDLAGAETLYREIISRWPENVVAHTGLAEILKAKDDLAGAETLYRETISRWPENVVAHNGLAEVLKAKDDLAGAETLYREIISRWPHDVVAPNGFANVLRKQRRFTDALASLPESTRLMSQQDFINLHLRGMILLESGDVEAAIDAFERGLASSPWACQQAYFRSALVVAKLREQHYREALQQLDALRESKPEFHTLRLHALAGEGEEQRARELHTELTAKLLVFRRPIRATIRCLDDAYGLTSATILRQPTPSQLDGIISAEVDMLLAA